MTTQEIKSAAGTAIEVDAIRMPGATAGQVPVCDSNGNMVPGTPSGGGGAVSSPQTGVVVWSAQQTFNGGIYGAAGLVIAVPIGQTIYFDINGSSAMQLDPNGMLSVGDVPVMSAAGVVTASTGFAAVGAGNALVPLISLGSGTRIDVGFTGFETNLNGTFVKVAAGLAVGVTSTPATGQIQAESLQVTNSPSGTPREAASSPDGNTVALGAGSFGSTTVGVQGVNLLALISQGTVQVLGGFGGDPSKSIVASGSTYTATKYDFVISCDPSTGAITVDLSGITAGGAFSQATRTLLVVDVTRAATTNHITISGDTINGTTSVAITTNGGAILLISGGSGHGWLAFALPVA